MSEALPAAKAPRLNLKVLVAGAVVVLPLLAVLVLNMGHNPAAIRSPLVGKDAPPFSLSPVGGGPSTSLESLRGRPVVLNFWATWCMPCIQEHETLVEAARSTPSVQFLGVVYEDEEANTSEFLRKKGSSYPSLIDPDGKAAIAYGVAGAPETFFINAAGRIIEKYAGPLDPETLAALLARAQSAP